MVTNRIVRSNSSNSAPKRTLSSSFFLLIRPICYNRSMWLFSNRWRSTIVSKSKIILERSTIGSKRKISLHTIKMLGKRHFAKPTFSQRGGQQGSFPIIHKQYSQNYQIDQLPLLKIPSYSSFSTEVLLSIYSSAQAVAMLQKRRRR
jgi:hypothetical protein